MLTEPEIRNQITLYVNLYINSRKLVDTYKRLDNHRSKIVINSKKAHHLIIKINELRRVLQLPALTSTEISSFKKEKVIKIAVTKLGE